MVIWTPKDVPRHSELSYWGMIPWRTIRRRLISIFGKDDVKQKNREERGNSKAGLTSRDVPRHSGFRSGGIVLRWTIHKLIVFFVNWGTTRNGERSYAMRVSKQQILPRKSF